MATIRSDDEIVFRRARQELFETMKKFQQLVPGQSNRAMASWDDVELIVQDVQAQWDRNVKDTRFGRTKQWLRKMCDGMNNHSSALKLLPSESVYTSLIAGSVSMIIKVSDLLQLSKIATHRLLGVSKSHCHNRVFRSGDRHD